MDIVKKPSLNEAYALQYLEELRWNGAPSCPYCLSNQAIYHCGIKTATTTVSRLDTRRSIARYRKCGRCRKKFTVTVNTIMESTKIPLSTWIEAIDILSATPEGESVTGLYTRLKVSRRTAHLVFAKLACLAGTPTFHEEQAKVGQSLNTPSYLLRLGRSTVMENADGSMRTAKRLTFWPLEQQQVLALALRCGKPNLFPQR